MPLRAFSIANLASHPVLPAFSEPWYSAPEVPAFESRKDYQRWMADPTSTVPLFSLIEGENPTLRVSATNPAHKVHGIVVDYDTPVSAAELAAGLSRVPASYPVFAYNQTRRGGVRLVFAFEKPVFYYGRDTFRRLMARAKKELNLAGLFAGLDGELLHDADHFYTAGNNWTVNAAAHISSAALGLWLFDVLKKSEDFDKEGIEVPLPLVEKEVHARFPGRWSGAFTEGSRGIRFWAPEADNPTAAIVRKTGMTAFTGDRAFLSWSDIFGKQFIAQYQEDRIGRAIDKLYCDGSKSYYRQLPDGSWDCCDQTVTKRHLKGVFGLSDKARDDDLSEVERVLHHLELNKRIEGAVPFPHRREAIVPWNGKQYLNTATSVRLVPAASEPQDWAVNFPFLADYLITLFADDKNLTVFLAWLKVWYESCRAGSPRRGHALFVVGPPGTGKTLLSLEVLGTIFGGYANAQSFFVRDSHFNDSLFDNALWALDDQTILGDRKQHQKFSGLVKATVANPSMTYAKKYGYEGSAPFEGRFVVTLNEDPTSLGILPDTDQSLLDKVILLRTDDVPAQVKSSAGENHATVEQELPFFLRWLCDWEIPSWLDRDVRFGIAAWQDRRVLKEAQSCTESASLLQVIEVWLKSYTPEVAGEPWIGTASDLLGRLKSHEVTRSLLGNMSVVHFGRQLSQAISNGCEWVVRQRRTNNFVYHLHKDKLSDR